MIYLFILMSYLIGSIPCGLLLAAGSGIDIREQGSGNIGATNVSRLMGKRLGILTLLGDMAKAAIPMLLAAWLWKKLQLQVDKELLVVLCGGAAFLGHLFPLYLNFQGGKGVATALGVFIVLQPIAILFCLAVFVLVVYLSGFVSAGSLTVGLIMPLVIMLLDGPDLHILLACFIGLGIWMKHLDNIRRLLKGEEKSWKKKEGQEIEVQ